MLRGLIATTPGPGPARGGPASHRRQGPCDGREALGRHPARSGEARTAAVPAIRRPATDVVDGREPRAREVSRRELARSAPRNRSPDGRSTGPSEDPDLTAATACPVARLGAHVDVPAVGRDDDGTPGAHPSQRARRAAELGPTCYTSGGFGELAELLADEEHPLEDRDPGHPGEHVDRPLEQPHGARPSPTEMRTTRSTREPKPTSPRSPSASAFARV